MWGFGMVRNVTIKATQMRLLAAGGLVGLVGLATAFPSAANAGEERKKTINGVLTLEGRLACADQFIPKAYLPGTRVVVRSGAGKIVGTSRLSDADPYQRDGERGCELKFSIRVPKVKFYEISIGPGEPYATSYPELKSDGWQLHLVPA